METIFRLPHLRRGEWRENGAETRGRASSAPVQKFRTDARISASRNTLGGIERAAGVGWRSVEKHSTSGLWWEQKFIERLRLRRARSLAFRLKLIGPDRKIPLFDVRRPNRWKPAAVKGVLQLAAEKAGWGKPVRREKGAALRRFIRLIPYTAAVRRSA